MKILLSVSHPAHVHVLKHVVWDLNKRGHDVKLVARIKDVSTNLLDNYGFDYTLISTASNGLFSLGIEMLFRIKKLIPIINTYNPDIIFSLMDPSVAISAKICGKKYICLADTEHCKIIINLSLPFTDLILSPSCFNKDFGNKQVRYNGYHELAYLHPNYFTPNPEVFSELELNEGDPFIILRFISWGASHDIGHHGIQNKIEFVKKLEKYGRVLITYEGDMDPELEKYKIKFSPEKLHDLLYYATLYVGEGATTASECAVLGTHAIYVNTLRLGYTDEEENIYGLVYNFSDPMDMEKESLAKALELLSNPNLKEEGKQKREKLLADKVDVTKFIVEFIEKYQNNSEDIC